MATEEERTGEIGGRLRALRRDRGLSQRELAGPGVSAAYISRIEAGTRQPSPRAIRTLAAKLSVDPQFLESGEERRAEPLLELRLRIADVQIAADPADEQAGAEAAAVLAEATASDDRSLARRAQLVIATAKLGAGDHRGAARLLETLIAASEDSGPQDVRAHRLLAAAYAAAGRVDAALELLRDQLGLAAASSNRRLATRYALALARFAHQADHPGELTDVLGMLGALSQSGELWKSWAALRAEDARVALADQQVGMAEDAAAEGAGLVSFAQEMADVGVASMLLARIAFDRGDTEAASAALADAERIVSQWGTPQDVVMVLIEQTRLHVQRGATDQAESRARAAFELASKHALDGEAGIGAWLLGDQLAAGGEVEEAMGFLRESVSLLQAARRPHDLLGAARSLAKMLRDRGNDLEALDVLEQASAAAVELAGGSGGSSHPVPVARAGRT